MVPGEDDAGLGLVVAGESAAVLRARRAQRFVCLGSLRRAAHALDEDAAKIVGGAVAQKLRQLNPAAGSEVQYDDGTTLIRAQLTDAAPEMCQACVAPTFTVAQCQHKARRLDLGSAVEPQGRPNAAIQAWFYKDDETAAAAARWCSRVAAAKVPEAIRPAFRASSGVGVPKPDGTPRPLGIGDTAARFVATLVLDRVKGAASRALLPYQFGMCVNGGAGYTYKIIQRKMAHDGAAVSLEDEACAFNYMDQEVMYDLRANWI